MDLDLNKLRSFVMVAEQRSFIQAAELLQITQPTLTRQIQSLERDLRVTLLARDRRGVALTAPGRQLLDDARILLKSAIGAERRVRAAARDIHEFVVAFAPDSPATDIIREFRALAPQLLVESVSLPMDGHEPCLHDGRVDVGFVLLPARSRTVRTIPLFDEPRVAVLPAGPEFGVVAASTDAAIPVSSLRPLPLLDDPATLPSWRGDVVPRRRPLVNIDERLDAVARGAGFIVLPASTADSHRRDDVRIVELTDVTPVTVSLGYLKHRVMPELQKFADIARRRLAPHWGKPVARSPRADPRLPHE